MKKKVDLIFLEEILTNFKPFNVKTYYELNIAEMEAKISKNVALCNCLINKYFEPVEKIVWENRLSVVNLISSRRYVSNLKVPGSFINAIFKYAQVPVCNAQLTFEILTILEYDPEFILNCDDDGFLEQSQASFESSQTKLKNSETNLLYLITLICKSKLP